MSLLQAPIFVAASPVHGLGVFAAAPLAKDSIIEICPVLLFPKEQLAAIRQTVLNDYYFDWGEDGQWYAIALGYGSLYNHAPYPNADYGMDFERKAIEIYALCDIEAGEEIFINYNGAPGNMEPLWFEHEKTR